MESVALSRSPALSLSLSVVAISRRLFQRQRKHAMTNTFLTCTPHLFLFTKPKMLKTYQLMSLTDPCQAHLEIGAQEFIAKNGRVLTVKEIERRRKISDSKKGTIPWNKGRKHSEETIQRIRERTTEALSDPKVRKKIKGMQGTHSKKTREHLSAKHKLIWYERHKRKPYQNQLHRNWAEIIAATAKIGGYGERELDWEKEMEEKKKEIEKEKIARKRKQEEEKKEKEKKKKEREEEKKLEKIFKIIKKKMAAERAEKRRQKAGKVIKIPARSIRFVKQRLTKLHLWKKRLENVGDSKEIVSDSGDEWDIECTKERLDIGIALLDQLQLVKDGRKT